MQLNKCSACEPSTSETTGEETCRDAEGTSCDASTCEAEGGLGCETTCPDTLSDYCGGGGANGGSLAWLEMALVSILLAIFLGNALSIFFSKGVLPAVARCVVSLCAPKPEDPDDAPTTMPDEVDAPGLLGVVARVNEAAKRARALPEPVVATAPSDVESDDGVSELSWDESSDDDDLDDDGAITWRRRTLALKRRDAAAARRASVVDTDVPWTGRRPLTLSRLRVHVAPVAPPATAWPRPGEQDLGVFEMWTCPCGREVKLALRRDHLRDDCAQSKSARRTRVAATPRLFYFGIVRDWSKTLRGRSTSWPRRRRDPRTAPRPACLRKLPSKAAPGYVGTGGRSRRRRGSGSLLQNRPGRATSLGASPRRGAVPWGRR